MRKTFSISILLCFILLSACTAAAPQPTTTPMPATTLPPTAMPTNTALPSPTATQEPTSTPTPTLTPGKKLVSEAAGDYMIYKISDKLTFYDPAKDLHVPILPDWEVSAYSISSNNILAFTSARDGDLDIYLLDYPFTENEPHNITDELDTDDWVELWSPDGQYLAFESKISFDQKMLSIWDGTSISQIYDYNDHLGAHAWGTDGRLVFTRFFHNDPAEIFLWDGDTVINVSQNPSGEDRFPVWGKDGQLVFNSCQETNCNILVWDGISVLNDLPDKSTYQNITPEITVYYFAHVWTSSGTISFSGTEGNFVNIYEWDGQTVTEISNNPNFSNGGQSWSKDGYWAFTTYYHPSEHNLYIRDEKNQTILETEGMFPPVWSDEGYLMYCVYDRTDDSSTWTLSIWDGKNIHNVIEIDASIWAFWPNGEFIVCSNG